MARNCPALFPIGLASPTQEVRRKVATLCNNLPMDSSSSVADVAQHEEEAMSQLPAAVRLTPADRHTVRPPLLGSGKQRLQGSGGRAACKAFSLG